MTPEQKLWIKAVVFTLGALIYVVFSAYILISAAEATSQHPAAIPEILGGVVLTLSAAVGGYLAKILGVPLPNPSGDMVIKPLFHPTPSQLINAVVWCILIAYGLIAFASFGVDLAKGFNSQIVPAVVAAQWKVGLGLTVATFSGILSGY